MMMNNPQLLFQRLQQFKQTINGNPQQQVQQMLNSGKVTQQQYNNAVQQAKQIAQMFGIPVQ